MWKLLILFDIMCNYFFSRTEQNIVAGDKLSPGTKPGFFKSEENVKLDNLDKRDHLPSGNNINHLTITHPTVAIPSATWQ